MGKDLLHATPKPLCFDDIYRIENFYNQTLTVIASHIFEFINIFKIDMNYNKHVRISSQIQSRIPISTLKQITERNYYGPLLKNP